MQSASGPTGGPTDSEPAEDETREHADERTSGDLSAALSLLTDVMGELVEEGRKAARELPSLAVRLPIRGLNLALVVAERSRAQRDDLRRRAEAVVGLVQALRGSTHAAVDDEAEQFLAAARDAQAREESGRPADFYDHPGAVVTDLAARAAAGKRASASGAADVADVPAGELPLAGFDNMSLGALRSRLPRLDAAGLRQLLAHERVHGQRAQVVTMLENRLAKVEAGTAPARKAAPRKAAARKANAPDGRKAQAAAEEFGSNSPHP